MKGEEWLFDNIKRIFKNDSESFWDIFIFGLVSGILFSALIVSILGAFLN